jgi:hypothetical protein
MRVVSNVSAVAGRLLEPLSARRGLKAQKNRRIPAIRGAD